MGTALLPVRWDSSGSPASRTAAGCTSVLLPPWLQVSLCWETISHLERCPLTKLQNTNIRLLSVPFCCVGGKDTDRAERCGFWWWCFGCQWRHAVTALAWAAQKAMNCQSIIFYASFCHPKKSSFLQNKECNQCLYIEPRYLQVPKCKRFGNVSYLESGWWISCTVNLHTGMSAP